MFEHFLILVTPSGGFIFGKAKERVCSERRTNLVVVFGREKVKLEGDLRGRGLFTLTPALSPLVLPQFCGQGVKLPVAVVRTP
jgi:hypothetical protein